MTTAHSLIAHFFAPQRQFGPHLQSVQGQFAEQRLVSSVWLVISNLLCWELRNNRPDKRAIERNG